MVFVSEFTSFIKEKLHDVSYTFSCQLHKIFFEFLCIMKWRKKKLYGGINRIPIDCCKDYTIELKIFFSIADYIWFLVT